MADVYDEHIRLAQRLEELGWHSYFVIEHQNSPIGRITAPTIFLTAVARATSRLRLGAMMWQLPFYHPLRLAQEVAHARPPVAWPSGVRDGYWCA
jgi:alkanesulfonate monooxygenase SsuD/methylene tetrahydromethanopterin reductase-like flavin-dependent oxidoreductase (luciferase family)